MVGKNNWRRKEKEQVERLQRRNRWRSRREKVGGKQMQIKSERKGRDKQMSYTSRIWGKFYKLSSGPDDFSSDPSDSVTCSLQVPKEV